MTIHVWKHWFWITLLHQAVLVLLVSIHAVWAEAGLLPGLRNGTTSSGSSYSTHYDVSPTNATPVEPTSSEISGAYDGSNSDMDDTYDGDETIFPIPIKKYHSKYSNLALTKKYKNRPKTEEIVEKYELSIHRISSSVSTSPAPDDLNATEATNTTDEALADDPVDKGDHTVALVQNVSVTETYTEGENDDRIVTIPEPFDVEGKMAVAAATTVDQEVRPSSGLDAGSITGITLGIVVIFGLGGAISFVLYRRRYLNKPQVLNDKSSTLDSSGYIDDASLRVGIPIPLENCMQPKENSEEMYSLDNDSFLNSLEAMTIQNYWTESVKHTKL